MFHRGAVLLGITMALVAVAKIATLSITTSNEVRMSEKERAIINNTVEANRLNSNILITAAHLGNIDGYTLLSDDTDRDVAYYIKEEKEFTTLPVQEVVIEGLEDCKIIKSEPGVFYVTTGTPDQIVNGMSGKRVYDSYGNEIGFIDALVKGQQIKCITLE